MTRQDDDIYMKEIVKKEIVNKEIVKKEIVEESDKLKSPMLDFSKFNVNCYYLSFGKYYYITSGSRYGKILIYDLRYKKIINQKKQKDSISSIKLSSYDLIRRNRMVDISSSTENIHFWDIKHNKQSKIQLGKKFIICIALSPFVMDNIWQFLHLIKQLIFWI
ncbi:hypothetical protein RFI_31469 [Reticulomyxa filosa]|uniref:WD repeat-containing protein n=1 Tax=Reticulomyxa filosa TaxID=46433 RepID=X6LXR7_RETFI|nr:hypothetical protein RFI_31469 [Reticulomyxa filosa]|eukprot:ETO05927.1 hypothetical protein RFI_31469 [Reticulomyxa filosa]